MSQHYYFLNLLMTKSFLFTPWYRFHDGRIDIVETDLAFEDHNGSHRTINILVDDIFSMHMFIFIAIVLISISLLLSSHFFDYWYISFHLVFSLLSYVSHDLLGSSFRLRIGILIVSASERHCIYYYYLPQHLTIKVISRSTHMPKYYSILRHYIFLYSVLPIESIFVIK